VTVYVGIVTYNSLDDLPHCLSGVHSQTVSNLEIVVFDNASSDGGTAWLRSNFPEIPLIVNDENIGYGRAHNRLIQRAGLKNGDYYLALNPDAALTPDYIAILVKALESQPDFGWGTGKLLMQGADGIIYSVGHGLLHSGFAFNIGYYLPDDAEFAVSREVFGAPGAAAIYKAELVHDLSDNEAFFDPSMFMYAEDTDVDWRARRQGWRCWYCADAVAYHRGSQASQRLQSMAVANRYLSVVKNAALVDLLSYNLPIIILHCAVRLMVTPLWGMRLIFHILQNLPAVIHRRRPGKIPDSALQDWFRWSSQQPTRQRSRFGC